MEINEFNRAVITQEITHDMAEQVALRIISGAFNRTDKRPQFSIPVRPDDDDIILMEYLRRQKSPWLDIESAPKDGTWIFIYRDNWHGAIKAKWGEIDGVDELFTGWVFQDEFLCIGCAEGCLGYNEDIEDGYMPTHWMPLPEPPR